jgi:hypothetical protein
MHDSHLPRPPWRGGRRAPQVAAFDHGTCPAACGDRDSPAQAEGGQAKEVTCRAISLSEHTALHLKVPLAVLRPAPLPHPTSHGASDAVAVLDFLVRASC